MRNLVLLDIYREDGTLNEEDVTTYKLELQRRLDAGLLRTDVYDILIQQLEEYTKDQHG